MSDNVIPLPGEIERGEALTEKIVELCDAEESNINVLTALMCALTDFFGRVCPDCQRRIVKGIKRELPRMVRTANEVAKRGEGTCH